MYVWQRQIFRITRQLYLPYIISGIVTVMHVLPDDVYQQSIRDLKSIPGSANLKTIMALGVGIISYFCLYISFFIPIVSSANAGKKRLVCTISWVWKNDTLREFLMVEKLFLWQSLVIVGGILSGIIFSKLILMLLYRMLWIFRRVYHFILPKQELRVRSLVFGVLYMLTSASITCCRCSLANPIELLHGGNVGEKKSRRPNGCDG